MEEGEGGPPRGEVVQDGGEREPVVSTGVPTELGLVTPSTPALRRSKVAIEGKEEEKKEKEEKKG